MYLKILFPLLLSGLISMNSFSQKIVWKTKTNLPKPMRGTAISCNNKIYFMEADKDISGVYEYSPVSDDWVKKTEMITQGWNLNLAEVNGTIYAIGGDPFRDRNESFDPLKNEWKKHSPMPTPRQHSHCCTVDGNIYVMGGITSRTEKTDKSEVYYPETDQWETLSPLPVPTENPVLCSIGSNIYALCGDTLRIYNTKTDTWTTGENCPESISVMFGSVVYENKFYLLGGQGKNEKALATVYVYDTSADKWYQSTPLPKPNQLGGITLLNNKIYIIGGSDTNFSKYNSVYEGTIMDNKSKL